MKSFAHAKEFSAAGADLPRPAGVAFCLNDTLVSALAAVRCDLSFVEKEFSGFSKGPVLRITNICDAALQPEEFYLSIDASGAQVRHSAAAGFYYAMQSLCAAAQNGCWQEVTVHDAPALALRGALLDIGRDKIPTLATLYEYIDFFAALRYNHLELYMEGYCFDYPKYRYLFPEATPLTADEFEALGHYAAAHFITLTPNQNCLGHMDQWLAKPQLKALAECPDGFLHQNLYMRPPMTLDATDDKAFDLIKYFLNELLPRAQGEYVNVNLDEPFELGRGKNKHLCAENGSAQLYLDFIRKMHALCAAHGKKMMLWGDVIFNHPEMIAQLPADVVLLDWIYEGDATFREHCITLQKANCEFCLCPGTSSWATFAGRSDNMVKNINDAVSNAVEFSAKGVMITDWGDLGHWQYFPVSQIAFVCCGRAMWTGAPVDLAAARAYCNRNVFFDANEKMFDLLYNLGNYYQLEHAPLYNTTLCFALMSSKYPFSTREEFTAAVDRLLKLCSNIAHENHIVCTCEGIRPDVNAIETLLENTLLQLGETKLCGLHADLLKAEIENTVAFIRHGLHLYLLLSQEKSADYAAQMSAQFSDLDAILHRHYPLWTARNRTGGFERSTAHLYKLLQFYAKEREFQ